MSRFSVVHSVPALTRYNPPSPLKINVIVLRRVCKAGHLIDKVFLNTSSKHEHPHRPVAFILLLNPLSSSN